MTSDDGSRGFRITRAFRWGFFFSGGIVVVGVINRIGHV